MADSYSNNINLSPNQVMILTTLQRLWIEHVLWTRFFINSSIFNTKDLDFVTQRLLRNPKDFSNILMQFYGNRNAMIFDKLLTDHLLIASQLLNALKTGNTAVADTQRKSWYANADNIAEFLSQINPYWDKNTWQSMMYDHLRKTEEEMGLVLTGKFADSINQYDMIQNQALKMADDMAFGMIKQFNI